MEKTEWEKLKVKAQFINQKLEEGNTPFWLSKYIWDSDNKDEQNVMCKVIEMKINDEKISISWSENIKGRPNIIVGTTYAKNYSGFEEANEFFQKINFIK